MVENKLHLAIVRIRDYIESNGLRACLFKAIKRTDEPLSLLNALRGTTVENPSCQPNGVAHIVQDVHFALFAFVAERFEPPWHWLFEAPCDGVPNTIWVGVPNLKIVCVDLEFGSGDDPVRGFICGIHGVDFGG